MTNGARSPVDGPYKPEGIDDDFVGATREPAMPAIGGLGFLRWMWRQLTSMRVALMLLVLVAIAAVPGSVLPQRPQDPGAVQRYLDTHATAGQWLDRFGFFDVYASVWFSAIYLLLFVSLIGCILPRTAAHLRVLRRRPPRAPRRFARFPVHFEATSSASPDDVAAAAARHLRGRRWPATFRVDVAEVDAGPGAGGQSAGGQAAGAAEGPGQPVVIRTVSAERGYLRETGNLIFHLALVGLLASVAYGELVHYRGQAIVTEGRGFANAVTDYDSFEHGSAFRASSLVPFSMTLDSFDAKFATDEVAFAQSRDFTAHVTIREPGSSTGQAKTIKVNHPLVTNGAKIYLQGNGFAPEVTVRDAKGEVAFSGRVPFRPEDAMYTSQGVIKVPDVSEGLEQIGLVGYLLPTAEESADGYTSVYPQPLNPLLVLDVYHGDLGLDEGLPQNVYRLDTSRMTSAQADGKNVSIVVAPGQTVKLPDGQGTITFESLPRFVALDLRHDPSLPWILTFALAIVAGLAVSLFTPRRRVWVRATAVEDGSTTIEVAGLARGDDAGLADQVRKVLLALPDVRPSEEDAGTKVPIPDGAVGVREAE